MHGCRVAESAPGDGPKAFGSSARREKACIYVCMHVGRCERGGRANPATAASGAAPPANLHSCIYPPTSTDMHTFYASIHPHLPTCILSGKLTRRLRLREQRAHRGCQRRRERAEARPPRRLHPPASSSSPQHGAPSPPSFTASSGASFRQPRAGNLLFLAGRRQSPARGGQGFPPRRRSRRRPPRGGRRNPGGGGRPHWGGGGGGVGDWGGRREARRAVERYCVNQ